MLFQLSLTELNFFPKIKYEFGSVSVCRSVILARSLYVEAEKSYVETGTQLEHKALINQLQSFPPQRPQSRPMSSIFLQPFLSFFSF